MYFSVEAMTSYKLRGSEKKRLLNCMFQDIAKLRKEQWSPEE